MPNVPKLPDDDREVIRDVAIYGIEEAAKRWDAAESTVKNRLQVIYEDWGFRNIAHAAWILSRTSKL